jgi:hypothetical protein
MGLIALAIMAIGNGIACGLCRLAASTATQTARSIDADLYGIAFG